MRGGDLDIQELIAEANAAERERLEEKVERLEVQRRELVQEYELTRDAVIEELRPLRRWVENRQTPVMDDRERVAEQRRLEEELREVRRRFRRERQELERELVEARDELARVEEADAQVVELVEELSTVD